jgi:hypothetical protein
VATNTATTPASVTARIGADEILKRTLTKAKYTIEVYKVDRTSYHLFDQAAEFLGVSKDEIKAFFLRCCDLTAEQDIFGDLPAIPKDFSTVAFDIATGAQLQIGQLTKDYYLQPEFYFHVGDTPGTNRHIAFRGWSQPELQYWGDNGHSSYPSEQWGNINKSKDNTARAVVFYAAGWNIQNYQGLMLVTDSNSKNFFDVDIRADSTGQPYFLLSPTFPKFGENWVEKVTVTIHAKPGTPAGDYRIGLNPTLPPTEINSKWLTDHRGIYFGGRGNIVAEGNQVDLFINVQE